MSAVNSTSFLDKLEFDCCGNENRFPFKETSGFFLSKHHVNCIVCFCDLLEISFFHLFAIVVY